MTDEERSNQYDLSRATKRLKNDLNLILKEPIPSIHVSPNEDDILDWHFVLQGRENTPYENGMYHGRLGFPPTFPFGPPKILFLTPNGRFKVNERICFSLSDFHPEEWKPAYSVTAVLCSVYEFMHETTETIGSIETSDGMKRQLAVGSKRYNNSDDTFCRMFPDLCNQEMVEDVYPADETGEVDPSDEFPQTHTPTDEYMTDTNFVRPPTSPISVNDDTTLGVSDTFIPSDVDTGNSQNRDNIDSHNTRQESDESAMNETSPISEHNTDFTNEFQLTNERKPEYMEITKSEDLTSIETLSPTQEDNIVLGPEVIEYYRRHNMPIPGMIDNAYNNEILVNPAQNTFVFRDTSTPPVIAAINSPTTEEGRMKLTEICPPPDQKEDDTDPSKHSPKIEEYILLENSDPNYTIEGNSSPVDDTTLTRILNVSPGIPQEQVTRRSKYISRSTGNSPIKRTLSPPSDINVSKRSKYSPRDDPKLSKIKTSSSHQRNIRRTLHVTRPFTITPTTSLYIYPQGYRIGELSNSYRLGRNTPCHNQVIIPDNALSDESQITSKGKVPFMYKSKGMDDLRYIEEGRLVMRRFSSPGITVSEINCYYSALLLTAVSFAIALLYLLAELTITLK